MDATPQTRSSPPLFPHVTCKHVPASVRRRRIAGRFAPPQPSSSASGWGLTASSTRTAPTDSASHAGPNSSSTRRSLVAAAARTPSARTSLMSTRAVLNGNSKVSNPTTPFPSEEVAVGTSALAAMAPDELSLSSALTYVSSTLGNVPAATAASTAAALPRPTSTLPTSTPAMREPDALTSPERPGSQNHMRIPSPAPRTLLLVVSPFSFSPSSFSSLSARFASALPMICSVRIAPPCQAPPPRATFFDWFITVIAHSRSAISWHT
mmetsp:Transcript_2558/g.9589  ORF Transcript_2558/g.9589 Transcript_2558/m.9589 type:complete len:266 (-) Transcript_2558:1028-1825(-)